MKKAMWDDWVSYYDVHGEIYYVQNEDDRTCNSHSRHITCKIILVMLFMEVHMYLVGN